MSRFQAMCPECFASHICIFDENTIELSRPPCQRLNTYHFASRPTIMHYCYSRVRGYICNNIWKDRRIGVRDESVRETLVAVWTLDKTNYKAVASKLAGRNPS